MAELEYLDIFNDKMEHLGIASRDEVHEKGYWHHSFHCWLIRRHSDRQYVLFQRRGSKVDVYPNTLDITAAGHLMAGEMPEDGVRELNEELGLSKSFKDLVPLGIRLDIAVIGPVTNREICHVYLLESNISLDAYRLQAEEVDGIVQMELYEGMRFFADEVKTVTVSGFQVEENGTVQKNDFTVSKEDLIPRIDNYYLKVFIMAERYFQGNPYLAI